MEWPSQSPDLNPIKNLWIDIKHAAYEAKSKSQRNFGMLSNHPGAGIPTDEKQISETIVEKLNISD